VPHLTKRPCHSSSSTMMESVWLGTASPAYIPKCSSMRCRIDAVGPSVTLFQLSLASNLGYSWMGGKPYLIRFWKSSPSCIPLGAADPFS
jgi:hypothetical protein